VLLKLDGLGWPGHARQRVSRSFSTVYRNELQESALAPVGDVAEPVGLESPTYILRASSTAFCSLSSGGGTGSRT
jgi:hypothetical protein